ncbi:MAG: fatty acid desaturase [Bacteroidia bacterium]|jgi:fatty acid desaturase
MNLTASISSTEWQQLKVVSWPKGMMLLLGDWAIIGAAIAVFSLIDFWPLYPLLVIVIGSRMMGLWALLHDGHHNMLVGSKPFNQKLTQWFIAWPLFKSLAEYDKQHNAHHKFLGADGDPNFDLLRYDEFQFPMKKSKLAAILIKDLLGFNFIYYRVLGLTKNPLVIFKKVASWNVERILFVTVIIAGVFYFNIWLEVLLFWLVPLVTYFQFLIRVTLIADHCFADNSEAKVRTVKLNWFESTFMVPHNLSYHYEHHHFGGIPSYNLCRLQQKLSKNPEYIKATDFSHGYLEVFRKVTVSG